MHFRFPNIDSFSFWLGFILASVVWWVLSLLRPAFEQLRENAKAKQVEKKEKAKTMSGMEERYRQTILVHVQGFHLAAPLFSLDEIAEAPAYSALRHVWNLARQFTAKISSMQRFPTCRAGPNWQPSTKHLH